MGHLAPPAARGDGRGVGWRRCHQLRVEHVAQFLHGGALGARQPQRQGPPRAVGQEVPLAPTLAPGGEFAPVAAAARRLAQAASRRRSRAQARWKQPCAPQSWNRAWPMDLAPPSRGSAAHWLLVRARQISPAKMARAARRGRPGFWRGLARRRPGCTSAHNASSTRQIGGSSLVVGAAAAALLG